jgi:GntR family transcriptional regulator
MLSLARIGAPADVADALRLRRHGAKGDVFRLTTLVRLGGVPVYHSSVFLPTRVFPKLRRSLLPDGAQSLYSLYQRNFNVNVTKVIDSLIAAPAPREVARLCGIPARHWVLRLKRVAFTYDDVPVEMRINWISTSNHCYRIVQGDRS